MRKQTIPYGEPIPKEPNCLDSYKHWTQREDGQYIRVNPYSGSRKVEWEVVEELLDYFEKNNDKDYETKKEWIEKFLERNCKDSTGPWSVYGEGDWTNHIHDRTLVGMSKLFLYRYIPLPKIGPNDRLRKQMFGETNEQLRWSFLGYQLHIQFEKWNSKVEELFNRYLLMGRFEIDDQFIIEEEDVKDFINIPSDEYDPKIHNKNLLKRNQEIVEEMRDDVNKKIDEWELEK